MMWEKKEILEPDFTNYKFIYVSRKIARPKYTIKYYFQICNECDFSSCEASQISTPRGWEFLYVGKLYKFEYFDF